MTTTRKSPEDSITEAISVGMDGQALFKFRRHGARDIVAKLNADGFVVVHADDLRAWAKAQGDGIKTIIAAKLAKIILGIDVNDMPAAAISHAVSEQETKK